MNVESSQAQSQLVLELGSEPLLHHVIAALHVQILESHGVCSEKLVCIVGNEGDSKQTSQVVGARTRGNLKKNSFIKC